MNQRSKVRMIAKMFRKVEIKFPSLVDQLEAALKDCPLMSNSKTLIFPKINSKCYLHLTVAGVKVKKKIVMH